MWGVVPWGRGLEMSGAFVVPGGEAKEGRAFGGICKALGRFFSFSFFLLSSTPPGFLFLN